MGRTTVGVFLCVWKLSLWLSISRLGLNDRVRGAVVASFIGFARSSSWRSIQSLACNQFPLGSTVGCRRLVAVDESMA